MVRTNFATKWSRACDHFEPRRKGKGKCVLLLALNAKKVDQEIDTFFRHINKFETGSQQII